MTFKRHQNISLQHEHADLKELGVRGMLLFILLTNIVQCFWQIMGAGGRGGGDIVNLHLLMFFPTYCVAYDYRISVFSIKPKIHCQPVDGCASTHVLSCMRVHVHISSCCNASTYQNRMSHNRLTKPQFHSLFFNIPPLIDMFMTLAVALEVHKSGSLQFCS